MKRTEVQLEPNEALNFVDYVCELMEFASDEANIIRLADDKRYQDADHYIGSRVKKELLRLNLIEPGEKGKLKITT